MIGTAFRWVAQAWAGIFALCAAVPFANASADGTASPGFAAPIFDSVVSESADRDLMTYRFLGRHDWPALRFFATAPLDWREAGVLAVPFDNPADRSFRLLLRIDDRVGADGDDRSLTGTIDLPAHARGTVILPLDAAPLGMVARPPGDGGGGPGLFPVRQVRGSVDLGHVTALHLSGVRTEDDRTLRLGTPVPRPAAARRTGPIVDGFGQAIEGDWPEKVASLAELRAKLHLAEAQTLRLSKGSVPSADRYGGVDARTSLAATGYFRVEKTEGRWSLVTPAGHRFFSLGVDSVASSNPTIVEGRTALFATPPPDRIFDIGETNLRQELGPGWRTAWRVRTLRRLKAWGFNTLGNWSSPDLTAAARLPFVEFYDVEGGSAKVPMPGGRDLPDPFDPRFAEVADAVAKAMTATRRDDPYLIGYFSGNELPWGSGERPEEGIAAQIWTLGPDSPARQAMIQEFSRRYGSVEAFSSAWSLPRVGAWDDLLKTPPRWPASLTPAARRDVADFQRRFATLYFTTVARTIHRHDPHHLYLGTRFADAPPEVVEACARWCDVMSFNVYGLSPEDRAPAWRGLDRPVLIGEFHFGSTDRGSFWPGMVEVGAEAERGPAYAAYVAQAVEDPQVVGCHWYQYADEPLTGRPYDGENGHIGLVAVTDLPFAGFVEDLAAANRTAMARFAGQGAPDLRGTE